MITQAALRIEEAMSWLDEHMWPTALSVNARAALTGTLAGVVITAVVSSVMLLW